MKLTLRGFSFPPCLLAMIVVEMRVCRRLYTAGAARKPCGKALSNSSRAGLERAARFPALAEAAHPFPHRRLHEIESPRKPSESMRRGGEMVANRRICKLDRARWHDARQKVS